MVLACSSVPPARRSSALPSAEEALPTIYAMTVLLSAFAVSWCVTLWVVHGMVRAAASALDHEVRGPQKYHAKPVPRVGGLGIFIGVTAAALWWWWRPPSVGLELLPMVLVCALPVFLAGLAEDLTKTQSPRRRMLFTLVSAALAIWLLGASLTRTDIPGLDSLVATSLGAIIVTLFAVAGVVNAVNIIDGFNGLASMCCVLILASLAYVGYQVGDPTIGLICLAGIGAILGFFLWNFPSGSVFLGDGGAYFLGFYVAQAAVLLLHRNPDVSPMFPLLVCIYPIFETLFSIYRKKFLRGMSPGVPDAVHFHMLVYRRLMRWAVRDKSVRARTRRNSMTSPYLWGLCMLSVVPAMLFWDNTPVLAAFILLFALTYVFLYWRIVRFRAPRWLVTRR
jgi:UDP-N-acetylmuramyl pentapeptide phosphotransferase/UDP-N-acetylglucosamine-1-phosphate transferase